MGEDADRRSGLQIEAWEKDHSIITEIGVSTLDTNDLVALPPGEGGKNWKTAIRPRHFRIAEYQHLSNQDFIVGCADSFEKEFGTSTFISINEAPQTIASCFNEPFSAGYQMKSHNGPEPSGSLANTSNEADSKSKRNIILVGHNTQSDVDYMRSIGYDVRNLRNLLEAIDTADMFKALRHEGQSRSLGGVLLELEMVGWNLHNAVSQALRLRSSRIPKQELRLLRTSKLIGSVGERCGIHPSSYDWHRVCRSAGKSALPI